MTITLPIDLENRLQAAVREGRFASVDAAMTEAARLLLRNLEQTQVETPNIKANVGLGSIGAMQDAADELDQIVADAYRRRREDARRDLDVE